MMNPHRIISPRPHGPRLLLSLVLGLAVLAPVRAEAPALEKPVPENIKDLRAIQKQVKKVLAKAMPCTVGIRIGNGAGSGVIISKDGYVLTAGHISGKPDRDVKLILADGRSVNGKTLGSNRGIDSGLIQITDKGDWPFAEMGDASKLKPGQWCVALGHPDGYKRGRPPVVRLGRVLSRDDKRIRTSCALVGGDSGGPLFDMDGKVIGIHTSIGGPITFNLHVPVDTYRATMDRLVKSEVWGGRGSSQPYIGVHIDPESKECRVLEVDKDSPAAKAGLKPDDVLTRFDMKEVNSLDDLRALVRKHKPGDEVPLEVQRGKKTLTLKVVVGKSDA